MELVYLIVGVLLGAVLGFLIGRNKKSGSSQSDSSMAELKGNLSAMTEMSERLKGQHEKDEVELKERQQKIEYLTGVNATLIEQTKNFKEKLDNQKSELEDLNKKFKESFKNLANEILEEKSQKFTDQNKENLSELLTPLRERIKEFQQKVEDSNTAGEKRSVALSEQLKFLKEQNLQLTSDAKSLTMALRGDSKAQGNWGEMQLESILEKAGLEKDVHYFKEKNLKSDEGANQRLDFIINMPDGKHLVLDSKVSLTAYARYFDTEDEDEKELQIKEHMNSLYSHIKILGEKNYQGLYGINAPDYVMMFIANEPALTMALKEDPQLYEKALTKNIAIVSGATLMATLRTISYIWKQDLQNKNAEEIARQAGSLYDKFVNFTDDLKKLGNQIETAQKTYLESMKKLTDGKDNLVRKTERIKELGAKTSKDQDQRLIDRSSQNGAKEIEQDGAKEIGQEDEKDDSI
ncbi:DNA recombination protein RmuC [Crocinitomix catalasitica]|nr:DNA recombination protein RmuC [Crocinitomix catalasitica]